MKFEDVLPALRAGKKIRKRTWCKDTYIYIDSYGKFKTQSGRHYEISLDSLYDLELNSWEIVKEKKKVKLRDLTEEQYKKWFKNNCDTFDDCDGCPFSKVRCINYDKRKNWWIDNKDLYSDKFLNQEIEIEE